MVVKIIEIALFVVTMFLLWLSCYPDYVVVWGKLIVRPFKRGSKETRHLAGKTEDSPDNKQQ
jgi:hypothetical protein